MQLLLFSSCYLIVIKLFNECIGKFDIYDSFGSVEFAEFKQSKL